MEDRDEKSNPTSPPTNAPSKPTSDEESSSTPSSSLSSSSSSTSLSSPLLSSPSLPRHASQFPPAARPSCPSLASTRISVVADANTNTNANSKPERCGCEWQPACHCVASSAADCAAVCCCPCALLHLIFIKFPSSLAPRVLARIRRSKKKKKKKKNSADNRSPADSPTATPGSCKDSPISLSAFSITAPGFDSQKLSAHFELGRTGFGIRDDA